VQNFKNMRFRIKFSVPKKNQLISFNYHYPLSAWIYKVFEKSDKEFSEMLHQSGYKLENGKNFKLFTFSDLYFPKGFTKPQGDALKVWSNYAFLELAFELPEQFQNFVAGLFKDLKLTIANKKYKFDLEVETIETLPKIEIPNNELKLKSKSMIVLGIDDNNNEHNQESYVPPTHLEYKKVFIKNLIDKNIAANKSEYKAEDIDIDFYKISLKTKMQLIKEGSKEETAVRGYNYEFIITAPEEIIQTGLNAGFGSMNSLGFGYCERVENKK